MTKIAAVIGVVGVVVVAAVGADGRAGGAGNPVVEVGRNVITKGMLDHWIPVTAIKDYELVPRGPVPKGVVPDPPKYPLCIARLESSAGAPSANPPRLTPAQLKAQCEQQYQAVRRQVLRSLITAEWLISEGEERRLRVTKNEVMQRFKRVIKNQFVTNAAFTKYLADTGETVSDQLFRSKIKVFTAKIEQQIMTRAGGGERGRRAVARFLGTFASKWAANTRCHKGYVVPNCSEYKGATPPEAVVP